MDVDNLVDKGWLCVALPLISRLDRGGVACEGLPISSGPCHHCTRFLLEMLSMST